MCILGLTITRRIHEIESAEEGAQVWATAGLFGLLVFGDVVLD